ncbi:MAG: hypothetical protein R3B72_12170 [Polyangiaceae bacterium]
MNTKSLALAMMTTLTLACSSTPGETDPSTGGGGSGASDPGGGDQGGSPEPQCPAPQGPTFHTGIVEGHEIWTAEGSPHIVTGRVDVVNGATLEVEPCAIVELEQDVDINVAFPTTPNTGTLLAEGTPLRPIVFRSHEHQRWGHILVQAPGVAKLRHVTIEGGGGTDPLQANLIVHGDDTSPAHRDVLVDAVTVVGSLGTGVVLDRMAGFAAGSRELTITGNGNPQNPYPLRIDEHGVDTIPTGGSYRSNWADEILVDPRHRLSEDAVMHEVGVPYRIGDEASDSLVIGRGNLGGDPVTLTIEPGVTLKFHPETSLRIEHETGPFPASGILVAEGTADMPITFTSAAEEPAPGDWAGLWFGGIVDERTSLAHVEIAYTGADCGCLLLTCSALESFAGAVILTREPPSAFVHDSVVRDGSGHAFVLGYDGTLLDFMADNTVKDVAGCPLTLPSSSSCPSPRPACL